MNILRKIPGYLLVLSFVFASLVGSASAQSGGATGVVELSVVACDSISGHGPLSVVPADCVDAGGTFTFYLRGDGTADYDQLHVPETVGVASITLVPGTYEVVEENTQTHFDVVVTSGVTTYATFGFAIEIPPGPESIRLYVTSLVCKNYEAASFDPFTGTIPAPCTRVGGDVFSLYLYGDGTNDYVQVTSSASGEAYIDLYPGRYEIVHEPTQMKATLELYNDYSVVFTRPTPVNQGVPTPTVTPKPAGSTVTPTPAAVSKLPNTGSGSDNGGGWVVVSAAMATVLVAAGVTNSIRREIR